MGSRKILGTQGLQLTSLHSLTLIKNYSGRSLAYLLSPAALPSLRVLALPDISGVRLHSYTDRTPFLGLLPQLHAIFVPAQALSKAVIQLVDPFLPRTLVDLKDETIQDCRRLLDNVRHIRIRRRHLEPILTCLNERHEPALRSIYLEIACQRSLSTHLRRTLINTCERRSIEVIYEVVPRNWNFEPGISEEFLRRQRECRRIEAALSA